MQKKNVKEREKNREKEITDIWFDSSYADFYALRMWKQ